VHDLGYIDSGLTSSMEMVAVCDEIIAMARTVSRGIATDDVHLALDVIHDVGIGGNYMAAEHTARHFRTEHFLPGLLDRRNFDNWQQDGRKSLEDRANERVLEILKSHRPAPLPDAARETIDRVLARAAART
jgi:trimethylamine--corrinoid protein Co-methyltransferase